MFVLGIDPGLTTTGYGVISAEGPGLVAVGVIRTAADRPIGARLVELHEDLSAVLRQYRPQAVAIEAVFVNRNRRTAMAVGRASGVALHAISVAGIEASEYTPTAVKSAVAGYGGAPKEQVQRMVASRLGLPVLPEPADAADALAVALCHLHSMRMEATTRRATRRDKEVAQ